MEEKRLQAYFRREMLQLFRESEPEPDGFRSYFASHEPKDEEILGLLAISVASPQFLLRHRFPTPFEALAALSAPGRAAICDEFRRRLKVESIGHA
jgi:hypothetical protein